MISRLSTLAALFAFVAAAALGFTAQAQQRVTSVATKAELVRVVELPRVVVVAHRAELVAQR